MLTLSLSSLMEFLIFLTVLSLLYIVLSLIILSNSLTEGDGATKAAVATSRAPFNK